MNNFTTSSPNLELLRDDIIGSVIQRTKPAHTVVNTTSQHDQVHFINVSTDYCDIPAEAAHFSHDTMTSKTNTKRNRETADNFLASKWQEVNTRTAESTVKQVTTFQGNEWVPMVNKDRIKKLREFRRNRQRLYRKRQEDRKITLEQDTQKLREKIQELQQRYRDISPGNPTNDMWTVVAEYFRLFRIGVPPATMISSAQLDFVKSTMAADVVFNVGRGAKSFIADRRHFSRFIPDFQLELRNMEKDTENSLVVTTMTKFTITEPMLQNLFSQPCTCTDESESLGSNVKFDFADKLLNKQILVPGTIRFVWDHASRRITSVMSRSDMLTPMLQLVGTVENLARVFQHLPVFV